MLTSDTKRHIDAARQVLVGIVPDPKAQIDQITNALIYKFMDDMDQSSIKVGGKPSFFIGDLEKYSWTSLMDSRLGNQERMNLYGEAVTKFGDADQLPELFREIFKKAYLPYRDPETLSLFLKEISYFDYSHSEELGNAYEYLLSIMSSQGDAGQFRTPRHIIDFIVEVVSPTKDDSILDPACGTAGFLISAYKHILKQHDGKDADGKSNKEKPLTPEQKRKLVKNFQGYDLDPAMVRIAKVNMYLHKFKQPQIFEYNTLASEDRWNDKFDIMLANPPFMSPKGGVRPHSRFSVESSRSEVLFVDYIMTHLKPKGRAGIIVPEGVIFQTGSTYKQLRKLLVEDGLFAVVSLPSGVFNPYSGVKTSILFFDNDLAKKTHEILFVRILNDGYDLGAQRKKIDRNDLPAAIDVLQAQKIAIGKGTKNKLVQDGSTFAWAGSKKEIAKNGDYSFVAERYEKHDHLKREQGNWPMVELAEIIETITPPEKIQKSEFSKEGLYPVIDQSQEEIGGWTNDVSTLISPEKPLVIFGDHTCAVKYVERPFAQGADGIKILKTNNSLLPKFLYFLLKARPIISDGYKRHFSKLKSTRIPLPPIGIQQQFVDELDGYQKTIAGAEQVVNNYKPAIKIDPSWPTLKIEDTCKLMTGGTPKSTIEKYYGGHIKWLVSGDIHQGEIYDCEGRITEEGMESSNAKILPINSVLIALNGQGKTRGTVAILKTEATCNQSIVSINPNNQSQLKSEFLLYVLKGKYQEIRQLTGDDERSGLNMPIIRSIKIPIPPIDIQEKIVKELGEEHKFVESAKKMISLFEQKIKSKIAEIWPE